jgi:hypothetical protein
MSGLQEVAYGSTASSFVKILISSESASSLNHTPHRLNQVVSNMYH